MVFVLICTIFDAYKRTYTQTEQVIDENKIQDLIELKTRVTGSNVIDSTTQSNLTTRKEPNVFIQFICNCSMYTNSERIFRTDNSEKFKCLNGLRALSMIWIILAHTFNYVGDFTYFFTICMFNSYLNWCCKAPYNMLTFNPLSIIIANIKELKDLEESPFAQLIINGMYGVDTFFVMR